MAIILYFIHIQNKQKKNKKQKKDTTHIQNKTKWSAVAGWPARPGRPAQVRGRARAGPGPRGPGLGPGARGGQANQPPPTILYICCIYFGIFCMYIEHHEMTIVSIPQLLWLTQLTCT